MIEVKPYYHKGSKKKQVEEMFDNISGSYDFLNRLLSLNINTRWRNELVKQVSIRNPKTILDVATGTGDLAIEEAKKTKAYIVGVDISEKMLEIGKQKITKMNLQNLIKMIKGDAEDMPFNSETFDVVTIAFGVRNFENFKIGFSEMLRVLKRSGELYILEFSKPEGIFAPFFMFYFRKILPKIGKFISKDSKAYKYLPASVEAFPYGEKLKNILKEIGYRHVKYEKLTFGIVTLYKAIK